MWSGFRSTAPLELCDAAEKGASNFNSGGVPASTHSFKPQVSGVRETGARLSRCTEKSTTGSNAGRESVAKANRLSKALGYELLPS